MTVTLDTLLLYLLDEAELLAFVEPVCLVLYRQQLDLILSKILAPGSTLQHFTSARI